MRRIKELFAVLLVMSFSSFTCEKYAPTTLTIVEGDVISCSSATLNEILVVQSGQSIVLDTLFADSHGFFTHQFTSYLQSYYLVPATHECSSVLTIIPQGQKSTLQMRQTPLFDALELKFDFDQTLIDSLRIRIIGVQDITNTQGEIVYRDPQNFDSGFISTWNTLPDSFILGENRQYSLITQIFPKSANAVIKNELITILNQRVVKTISL